MGLIKRVALACVLLAGMNLAAFAAEQTDPEESLPLHARKSACQKRFLLWDENRDKAISQVEFLKFYRGISPVAVFGTRDRNRDGLIKIEEFCGGGNRYFPRMP